MKFICTQENLYTALSKVNGLIGQFSTLSILKNVLIQAKNGFITIKATDLETAINTEVRGKIEQPGKITVDTKMLTGFIALLPQGKINLETKKNQLFIKSGAHKTKIKTAPADDFPVIPDLKKEKGFEVKSLDFKQSLSEVLPSVSSDVTRPEINGVYFNIKKESLILAGTDSYRLAEKNFNLHLNQKPKKYQELFSGDFIVPLKAIKELNRILDDQDNIVEGFLGENQVLFSCDGTSLVSRLIDGDYPDYQQIIPDSANVSFVLSRQDFLNAVKISGVFADVGSNSIELSVLPKKGQVLISSSTTKGEEVSSLEAKIKAEKGLKIVFDYRYLLDGLNSIATEQVVFLANSESSPALMRPVSKKQGFLYVLMPIRQ